MGWVQKRGDTQNKHFLSSSTNHYRRRWFLLDGPELSYYKFEVSMPSKTRAGTIDMTQVTEVRPSRSMGVENAIDIVTPRRVYVMRPEGGDEAREAWMTLLNRSVDCYGVDGDAEGAAAAIARGMGGGGGDDAAVEGERQKSFVEGLDKAGFLFKRGSKNRAWRARYFALSDGVLSYYTSEEDMLCEDSDAAGTVLVDAIKSMRGPITQGSKDKRASAARGPAYCFQVTTSDRVWDFGSDAEETMLSWMETICLVSARLQLKREEVRGSCGDSEGCGGVYKWL